MACDLCKLSEWQLLQALRLDSSPAYPVCLGKLEVKTVGAGDGSLGIHQGSLKDRC